MRLQISDIFVTKTKTDDIRFTKTVTKTKSFCNIETINNSIF